MLRRLSREWLVFASFEEALVFSFWTEVLFQLSGVG